MKVNDMNEWGVDDRGVQQGLAPSSLNLTDPSSSRIVLSEQSAKLLESCIFSPFTRLEFGTFFPEVRGGVEPFRPIRVD